MNERQARGCGISDHERMNTTTKKAANSIVGKLTAGIVAAAAALLATAACAHAAGDAVLVVGDSLELGSAPYLRQALPGVSLDIDARTGRPSREGVSVQSGAQVADWRSAAHSIPGVLGSDRTHPTAPGRVLRANVLADAIQSCLLGGELNGIPAPRDPNARPPR